MSLKDLANTHVFGQSLKSDQRTVTANGTGVDMRSTGPQVTAVLDIGDVTGTTPTLDVKLQDSDDNVTFADITGAVFTQKTDADSDSQFAITFFNRSKRYVRAVATIAGTVPVWDICVGLIGRKFSY